MILNPFVLGDNTETVEEDLPYLQEYGWDFQHDCFSYNTDGTHKIVYENDALEVWIYKAMKTERYRFDCYKHGIYNLDSNYGVELEQYIGKRPNDINTATEIKERIRECLEVNPYIKTINSIDIVSTKKDTAIFKIDLTSIYGDMETMQGVTL